MVDTISKLSMEPLLFSIDPMSLVLSQNSDTHQLKLLLGGFCGFERGARYDEYSRLRESKLRMKRDLQKSLEEEEEEEKPRKKQVRFEGSFITSREGEDKFTPEKKMKNQTRFGFSPTSNPRKALSSSLAQSVPDFSAVVRKENRRPVHYNTTPPPPSSKTRNGGVLTGSASSSVVVRGSKSASAGEKKSKGMARKSYANVEDLKKITVAAASALNGSGGGGGGRKAGGGGGGGGRTILGYRQIC